MTLVITSTVTLYGLDNQNNNPFTVSDSSGNQYQLLVTQTFSPGTYTSSTSVGFQAAKLGPVRSDVNTITNIITVTNGVSSQMLN